MATVAFVLLLLAAIVALLAFACRRTILSAWREPVLRSPVLILESDDWGYGPTEQAHALRRLHDLLERYSDPTGRAPVMTIGVVLAGPDTAAIAAAGCRRHVAITLDDPRLADVRNALLDAARDGVFALQLHAREHYWPECLLEAARHDPSLRNWLTSDGLPSTERLPPTLQSRWIDGTTLPSSPLPVERVVEAAADEARCFRALLGSTSNVAVPTTFIWTEDVERGWASAGVRVVVTPGLRNASRDASGRPVATGETFHNDQSSRYGLRYVVRDSYFEPALGHTHERTLADMALRTRLGRPTLVETHRANFLGTADAVQRALDELARLLEAVRASFPDVRYMSTVELVDRYRERSDLVERNVGARVLMFLRRLAAGVRARRLA